METFLILIPVTLALVALSLWAFVWSARNGQFEDIDRQGWSILFDNAEEQKRTRLKEPQADSLEDARHAIDAEPPQSEVERDGREH